MKIYIDCSTRLIIADGKTMIECNNNFNSIPPKVVLPVRNIVCWPIAVCSLLEGSQATNLEVTTLGFAATSEETRRAMTEALTGLLLMAQHVHGHLVSMPLLPSCCHVKTHCTDRSFTSAPCCVYRCHFLTCNRKAINIIMRLPFLPQQATEGCMIDCSQLREIHNHLDDMDSALQVKSVSI